MKPRMHERRSHARLLHVELVMICWAERGKVFKELANAEEISQGGIGVLLDYPVEPGTAVTIFYDPGELKGVVRRRELRGDRYFLAIEFVGDSKDSTIPFQPEFLVWPPS